MYTKECALFLPSDWALSVFGGDRRLLAVFLCGILDHFAQWLGPRQIGSRGCEDGHISFTLANATHFYCPLSIFKPRVYQLACRTYVSGKHMSLPTHTLPLSFCVYAAGYVCIQVRTRQRVWSVWTVAGLEFILFWFWFLFSGKSDFLAVRLLWLLLLKCDKNEHRLHFENNNLIK